MVPLVVIDTNIALPATLAEPGGVRRKFLVLLALGALNHRAEHLGLELSALEAEAAATGGEVGGSHALDQLTAQAASRRAAIAERLPYGTTTEWVMSASGYMIDEFERKAKEVGPKFGREIDNAEATMLSTQLLALSVTAPDPLYVANVPILTADPKDDAIVHDALRINADYLISDDKHIVPRSAGGSYEYEFGEHRMLAMRFDYLLENHLDSIDWNEIDGSLLSEALKLLDDDAQSLDLTG